MSKRIDGPVNPPWYVNVEFDGIVFGERRDDFPLRTGAPIDLSAVSLPPGGYSEKKRKRMPDFIIRWEIIVVSDLFREVLERLEPGVHQFVPFELRNGKRGEPTEAPYYILNIAQTANSIDWVKSNLGVTRNPDGTIFCINFPAFRSAESQYFMRQEGHGGMHVWRETYDSIGIYASDEFLDLCKKLKIRGVDVLDEYEDI